MSERERELRAVACVPGSDWNEKREAASELAEHGWPVLRGTYCLSGSWLGRRNTASLEPINAAWAGDTTTDAGLAAEWWSQRPYSVLLACGASVDALELDAAQGQDVVSLLHEANALGPIVTTSSGNWLLFVRAGAPLLPELSCGDDVVTLHGDGCWLALPPTAGEGSRYVWRVAPADVGWHVPESAAVQDVLTQLVLQVAC